MTELIPSNLFSEADTQLLMSRLWSLLAKQTERYTMGESTSVTVETAQELLASLWHTLTVAMDETNTPYTRLLTDDLLPVVKRGQTILQDKLARTKRLWEAVCQTAPEIQNFYYMDTLRGIGGFFQHYDLHFFAHQKPPRIDYPLLTPVSETLQGLAYTEQYLKHMLAENLILHQFEAADVILLLKAVAPDYQGFYLNLCEQPLTNAIGLALIGEGGQALHLSHARQKRIAETMQRIGHEKRQQLLRASALSICEEMKITDNWIRESMTSFADSLLPRLDAALDAGDVSHIFIGSQE
ncbi:MAG: DUF6179 domain-containing protein [Candidatus Avoscillospira sp.]